MHLFCVAILVALVALADIAVAADDRWQVLRTSLFGDRAIEIAAPERLQLHTPLRAADGALVPIAIRSLEMQTEHRYIAKLYLIIDRNPSPLGAVFQLTPASGRADIETLVRIEEYTPVRVIAEYNDGGLIEATSFVKASGGCSAPASRDAAAALANLGRMRIKLDEDVGTDLALAQLMVSHPNHSGLAMDQITRLYQPPHFVRRLVVTYRDRPVLSAEMDFSISENPSFRFFFSRGGGGELRAEVVDSENLQFSTSVGISGDR